VKYTGKQTYNFRQSLKGAQRFDVVFTGWFFILVISVSSAIL